MNPSIILHGGVASPSEIDTSFPEAPFLREALESGWDSLMRGEKGERVVVSALRALEACEYFDAGYGSFPNENGDLFMDVALMRGNGDFSSLMNLTCCRHPSEVAYDRWEEGRSLMRVVTPALANEIRQSSKETLDRYGYTSQPAELVSPYAVRCAEMAKRRRLQKGGTVGCVVRDWNGRIFAGTSTGGTPNKPDGRIGDSPIVCGGVFADDEIGGLSATGDGEVILKSGISGMVVAGMRARMRSDRGWYAKNPVALRELVQEEMSEMRRKYPLSEAGFIVMPLEGDPAYCFNAKLLYVAHRTGNRDQIISEEFRVALRG